jgi:S-phase kinase-associated protein 1
MASAAPAPTATPASGGEKKEAAAAAAPVKGLDDDTGPTRMLKLNSKDGKSYTVERKHAFISNLIKTGLENDDKADEFPVPGVTSAVLEKVVEYLSHHKGTEPPIIEKPLRSKVMRDVCSDKWDAEYIDRIGETRQLLYDLILAANYMDIKGLLHLGCAKVASLIKGQPLEKIKEILDPKQGGGEKKDEKAADKKGETKAETKAAAAPASAAPAAAAAADGKKGEAKH